MPINIKVKVLGINLVPRPADLRLHHACSELVAGTLDGEGWSCLFISAAVGDQWKLHATPIDCELSEDLRKRIELTVTTIVHGMADGNKVAKEQFQKFD